MSPAPATSAKVAGAPSKSWTCAGCRVTVRWMQGSEQVGLPAHWVEEDGELHCLGCRRSAAIDRAVGAASEESGAGIAKLRTAALIEFELKRDPDRNDGVIARACRSSVQAVAKVRRGLA